MQAALNSAIRGVSCWRGLERLGASTVRQVLHGGVHVPLSSAITVLWPNQFTFFCPDQPSPVLAARHHLHFMRRPLPKRLQQAKIIARPALEMGSKQQNHLLDPRNHGEEPSQKPRKCHFRHTVGYCVPQFFDQPTNEQPTGVADRGISLNPMCF